jgi:hypothetical protein
MPRIAQACLNCQHRKLKCDVQKPCCGSCRRYKIVCSYSSGVVETKRIRTVRACTNCQAGRRKCSGEFPRCSRCAKKSLKCHYLSDTHILDINYEDLYAKIDAEEYGSIVKLAIESFFERDIHFLAGNFLAISQFQDVTKKSKRLLRAIVGTTLNKTGDDVNRKDLREWWYDSIIHDILLHIDEHADIEFFSAILFVILWRFIHAERKWFLILPMVIRLAFSLKLHHEHEQLPHLDRELRRRMMWNCFLLDKFVAGGMNEFTACNISLIELALPSDSIESTSSIFGSTQPGILALAVQVGQLRHEVLSYAKSAARDLDHWWQDDSEMWVLSRKLDDIINGLPQCLVYSKENVENRRSKQESLFFVTTHLWLRQTLCDLFRLSIPGLNESSPEILLNLVPVDLLLRTQSDCVSHAVSVCDILSESSNLITGADSISDIIPIIYESCRLVLLSYHQNLSANMGLDSKRVGAMINCNLTILLNSELSLVPQSKVVHLYISAGCHQLQISEYVPVSIAESEIDRTVTFLDRSEGLTKPKMIFSRLHPAAKDDDQSSGILPAVWLDEFLNSLDSSYEDLLSTFRMEWPR